MKITQENGNMVIDITIEWNCVEKDETYRYITNHRIGGDCTEDDFLGTNVPPILVAIPVPALTGSEKQIAWAEDIRKEMVHTWLHEKCELYGWVARLNAAKEIGIDTYQEMVEKLLAANFPRLFAETSAKQIIENRHLSRF